MAMLAARPARNQSIRVLMPTPDKQSLTERDICTKFITPARRSRRAGTRCRRSARRSASPRAASSFAASWSRAARPSAPTTSSTTSRTSRIALIEAKDNNHSVGDGMQQALEYAETLDIPFVFSSNGDGFVFHDRTGTSAAIEANLALDAFPVARRPLGALSRLEGPDAAKPKQIVLQDYFDDGSGKAPRYYQVNADQRRDRGHRQGPGPRPAGHGDRHRQDLHRVPDHLAAVEGRAARSASCSSPTATSSSTRRWSTTSARSARRWRSSAPMPRPSSATMAPTSI